MYKICETRALCKQNIRESVVTCEQVLSGVWGAPGKLARRLSNVTRCVFYRFGQGASANHAVNCLFTFKLFRQFSSFRINRFSYF